MVGSSAGFSTGVSVVVGVSVFGTSSVLSPMVMLVVVRGVSEEVGSGSEVGASAVGPVATELFPLVEAAGSSLELTAVELVSCSLLLPGFS